MLVGFVGDVHGRAFHAVAALTTLQALLGAPLDLLIQVGDLGYPDVSRADEATRRYLAADPAEADLGRFLRAEGDRAERLRRIRDRFAGPIHFIRGNHDDLGWLAGLPRDPASGTAPADAFDLFRYVRDGTVLRFGNLRVAFLGGVEERTDEAAIDRAAYDALLALGPRAVDVLVTHEGPYGSSTGFQGDVHGSPMITHLLDGLRPPYHVFGHAHSLEGPRRAGGTTWLGLDALVASPIWRPEARGLSPGCMATLDTRSGTLRPVTDEWLGAFPTRFDFDAWADASGLL